MRKKLTVWLIMALVAFGASFSASAIDFTYEDLKAGISFANEDLPEEVEDGLYIILVELDDETKTLDYYFYTANEDVTISFLRENEELMEGVFLSTLTETDDPNARAIFDALRKFGYGLTITFIDDAEETVTFVYLADEI